MKTFTVYLNDSRVDKIKTADFKDAKRWIKVNVFSTHMGEWRKTTDGYVYYTTIGRVYRFIRE